MNPTAISRSRIRGWSLRLGRMAGVDVFVHATFAALLAWLAASELAQGKSPAAIGASLVFVTALFGCVVLHELGHALAARRYGIATRDITLYPIGGVARLERIPDVPREELVIALAGPLVNVAIAGVLLVALWVLRESGAGASYATDILPKLLVANVGLAAFNLLPAFPMDGGRVLRALLARRRGRAQATRAAARIGKGLAVLFALGGLFGAPTLLLIALFVWIAGEHEARGVEIEDALHGLTVARGMETRFHVLSPEDPISYARSLILAGAQVDVPLVDPSGKLMGLVGPEDVARGLLQLGESAPVSAVCRADVPCVDPNEPLSTALARLAPTPWRTAPVVDGQGRLLGLLSSENVVELVMFREAQTAHAHLGTGVLRRSP